MEPILIGDCEILVGHGLPRPLLPESVIRRRAVVITQPGAETVAQEIGEQLSTEGLDVFTHTLPDREEAKSLEAVSAVYAALAEHEVGSWRHGDRGRRRSGDRRRRLHRRDVDAGRGVGVGSDHIARCRRRLHRRQDGSEFRRQEPGGGGSGLPGASPSIYRSSRHCHPNSSARERPR